MELPKTAVLIKGCNDHWVDVNGDIYCINRCNNSRRQLIKKAQNTVHGYKYCGIRYADGHKATKRVHRIVAEAYIPNPNQYTVVGHKNNIKSDNRVENLYWTTTKENTQKAYDDGLAVNKKGFEDSQSMPVNMYDTRTNRLIGIFGSVSIAATETGMTKTGILHQARYKRPTRRDFYFRFIDDEDVVNNNELVFMRDYETDQVMESFINIGDAAKKTGVSDSTISYQCDHGKPKRSRYKFYFERYYQGVKCEETIETKVGVE